MIQVKYFIGVIFIKATLINAISKQLYNVFNKPNIYVEHIKQGFLLPCFCIRYVKTEEKTYLANRYKLFNKVEITYFPEKQDNISDKLNEVLNHLYNNFNMLNFEKGFIKAENMEGIINNNTLKFYVEYNFYVFKKDETDKMKKLYIQEILWQKKIKNFIKNNF